MLKDDIDNSITSLREILAGMGFLGKGFKSSLDAELVQKIQDDIDELRASYGAVFETSCGGSVHEPSAFELASWIFSGFDGQRLVIRVRPTSADEELALTVTVPVTW